jgi:hypothetical protein
MEHFMEVPDFETSKCSFQVFVNDTTSAASNGLMLNSELAGQARCRGEDGRWQGDPP